jgi:hypothetical protein
VSTHQSPGPRTTLILSPSELGLVFHAPSIEVDAGDSTDFVATACNCYLLWQSEYPDYLPLLVIDGMPSESATLNRALFGRAALQASAAKTGESHA